MALSKPLVMAAYAPRVENLFNRIASLTSAAGIAPGQQTFLQQLRADALRNRREWQIRLDPYMHSMNDQGMISDQELKELLALASQCPEPVPSSWEVFSPLGWLLLGALSVLGWLTLAVPNTQWIWFIGLAGLMGGIYGAKHIRRPSSQPELRRNDMHLVFLIAAGILGSVFASTILPGVAQLVVHHFNEKRHERDMKAFGRDPNGLPMLQKIAKDNFGVDVVLAEPKTSWQQTTLLLPSSSSASMNLAQGFCELNIDPFSLTRDFGAKDERDRMTWIHGVMMHELGHCLDVSRDLPAIGSVGEIHKFSLAPVDAAKVTNIQSYVMASRNRSTAVWREAYSDIMAIGYWKLTAPNLAEKLTGELRNKRETNTSDKDHSTMCWIDHASPAAAPANMKALASWSDELRKSASCKT